MKSAFSESLSLSPGSELVSEVRGFRDRGSSGGLGCGLPEPDLGVNGAEGAGFSRFSRVEGGVLGASRRVAGRSDSGRMLLARSG